MSVAFVAWRDDAAAADLSPGRDVVGRHRAAGRRGGEGVLRPRPRVDVPRRHAARAALPVRDRAGRRPGRRGHRRTADPSGDAPADPSWHTYVAVEDLDAALARVAAAGGTITTGPTVAGEGGTWAAFTDQQGADLRLWQPKRRLGAQIVNAPGAWNFSDLHTSDPAAAPASTPGRSGGRSPTSGSPR